MKHAFALALLVAATPASSRAPDPRLREIEYDSRKVVEVSVKRGTVLHVELDADEAITDVASGLYSDCAKTESPWCIAAQPGGRHLFIKAKSTASAANNLSVVTDKRSHAFLFTVLADGDAQPGAYQLTIKSSARPSIPAASPPPAPIPLAAMLPDVPFAETVAARLKAGPEVVNASYSIAEGRGSDEILPVLIFDDGRFTYLRFPNNREVPAVFHVLGDGRETVVNTRMEGDLLVVDRVSRRLTLRAGQAVVGVWNEAFDLDGRPPLEGTTVEGVTRHVRSAP